MFAMFATLVKERSDVIFNMLEGISPLVIFLYLGGWFHPIPQNTQMPDANLFVSFALSLILMMLGCVLYRKIAA